METTTILAFVGTAWAIVWGIFTFYVQYRKKKESRSVAMLASAEEVHEWQTKYEQQRINRGINQTNLHEEKRIKQEILRRIFSGFFAFIVALVKALFLGMIFGGSDDNSQAGGSGSEDASDRRRRKREEFYNENFPKDPDHVINFILGALIVTTLPVLLGFIEVGQGLKTFVYGVGGGAFISVIVRILKLMQREGVLPEIRPILFHTYFNVRKLIFGWIDDNDVQKMFEGDGFSHHYKNKIGKAVQHQYEEVMRNGDQLIIDKAADLMWQQSGSDDKMKYGNILYGNPKKYIRNLNKRRFAGYNDWRLPTLEEAMSLIEPVNKSSDLSVGLIDSGSWAQQTLEESKLRIEPKSNEHHWCISSVFDKKQSWIWTADKKSPGAEWYVNLLGGFCRRDSSDVKALCYVRAVRLIKANSEAGYDEIISKIRSKPFDELSAFEVGMIFKEKKIYDKNFNKNGNVIKHQYRPIIRQEQQLVIDDATGLSWQQDGSEDNMTYDYAKKYIQKSKSTKLCWVF